MKLTRTATLATVLALGLAAAAEAQDVVRLRNGTEVKAKVTAMTSQSITYSEGAGKVSSAKKEDVAGVETIKAFGRERARAEEGESRLVGVVQSVFSLQKIGASTSSCFTSCSTRS